MIPTEWLNDTMPEMSSDDSVVSGAGTYRPDVQAASDVVVCARYTRDPRVQVAQTVPTVSRAIVSDSAPPVAIVTGKPLSRA